MLIEVVRPNTYLSEFEVLVLIWLVLLEQKRGSIEMEIEEISESSQKRVKMRDLESVFRSEGTAIDEFP